MTVVAAPSVPPAPRKDDSAAVALRPKTAMWAKYSKGLSQGLDLLDPKTKEAPTVNLFNTAGYGVALPNFGVTIDTVAKRGVHFAICQMATRRLAGQIAISVGSTPDAIYEELVATWWLRAWSG